MSNPNTIIISSSTFDACAVAVGNWARKANLLDGLALEESEKELASDLHFVHGVDADKALWMSQQAATALFFGACPEEACEMALAELVSP